MTDDFAAAVQRASKFIEAADFEGAIAEWNQLQLRHPSSSRPLVELGKIYLRLSRFEDAMRSFEQAVAVFSADDQAWFLLGYAAHRRQRWSDAEKAYRQALAIAPHATGSWNNLGNLFFEQDRLDEAIECLEKVVDVCPELTVTRQRLSLALIRRGARLLEQGLAPQAQALFLRAIALSPESADAHNGLGAALHAQSQLAAAMACFRQAVALEPNQAAGRSNLAMVLQESGLLADSFEELEAAHRLAPQHPGILAHLVHLKQRLCHWHGIEALSKRLLETVSQSSHAERGLVPPFVVIGSVLESTCREQAQVAHEWTDGEWGIFRNIHPLPGRPRPCPARSRLRIGYLSGDFRHHPIAFLIPEVIERHDRARFEVIGYSVSLDDGSAARHRLQRGFDRFVELGSLSHREAAQRIADEDVDILVDLQGHTQHARTEILGYRPAPIQVNYLGYPATMGTKVIDYAIVDDYLVTEDAELSFVEKLVRLPGCYQANDSRCAIDARAMTRYEFGLPEEGVVMAAFCNAYKIAPRVFRCWMELLQRVPGSVLWLFESNRWMKQNLREAADRMGVQTERIVFAVDLPHPQHLARHRLVDLFLDTFPYNAHTSASDALRMGVPMVTCSGKAFASRVAGSLLTTIGVPELIASNLDEYAAIGYKLAVDREWRHQLRQRLVGPQTAKIFDGGLMARRLEQAYQRMMDVWCRGDVPSAIRVIDEPRPR